MKLIDEEEAEKYADDNYSYAETTGFMFGIDYAEQKLTPLMVGFAEWCAKHYIQSHIDYFWVNKQTDKRFTTKQLLEQFLKTKQ